MIKLLDGTTVYPGRLSEDAIEKLASLLNIEISQVGRMRGGQLLSKILMKIYKDLGTLADEDLRSLREAASCFVPRGEILPEEILDKTKLLESIHDLYEEVLCPQPARRDPHLQTSEHGRISNIESSHMLSKTVKPSCVLKRFAQRSDERVPVIGCIQKQQNSILLCQQVKKRKTE